MSTSYIDLNRSFIEIPKDHDFNEEYFDAPLSFDLLKTAKWNELLLLRRVIILAEAGAGKTEEIRASTNRLRRSGKKAFFLRLEHLSSNFETAFEIGDNVEFVEWIASDETGWFFLDSVDEARLRGAKQFEDAIRNFGGKLGDSKQRTHIYITSRLSEWRPQSDLIFIKDRLPFAETTSTTENQGKYDIDFSYGNSNIANMTGTKGERKPVAPTVFALRPLDQDQIRTYSKAFGIKDLEGFLTAIKKAEADIFTSRPQDLDELINYWNHYGKIGNRAALFEASIYSKLKETDPERAVVLPLNFEEAKYGAEMIAAAVTFMRKTRILIPEQNIDPAIRTDAVDVQDVVPEWNFEKVRALLQLPIFDEAIYGTVRFHHRSAREYLTAKWLRRLLLNGKSRRSIEGLFFAERYGQQVLVPSMRSVLSWLILFDDRVRIKTAEIAPEIFIQGGDPSDLPTDVRKNLLKQFCILYANKEITDLSFDISDVRRFAHPDLGETVCNLLETYSGHRELMELLLRIIWQGNIQTCSEQALDCAMDDTTDIYTRVYGFRAIEAVGTEQQKRKLVDAIIANPDIKNERLIGELITSFTPDILGTQDILTLIQRINSPKKYSVSSISHSLKEFSLNQCPESAILEWVRGLLTILKQPPVIEKRFFEISKQYSWLLPYAVIAVERLVRMKHRDALDESVIEIISMAQADGSFGDYHTEAQALTELVPKWSELNHALFWFDVDKARRQIDRNKGERLTRYWHACSIINFWRFSDEYFEKTLEDIRIRTSMDDRLVALSLSFQIYVDSGRGRARRTALKRAVHGVQELEEALNLFLNPPPLPEEDRRLRRTNTDFKRRQKLREKKETVNQKKWLEWLQKNTAVLRDTSIATEGKVWKATDYLMRKLRDKQGPNWKWANSNWENLIPEFGQNVAEAYRDGCMDYWRKYYPRIRSEGIENPNSTPVAIIVGLIGLDMEARHTPDWPRNLSNNEAELACRYAVHELNGFPDWLQRLHSQFPNTVEAQILNEIEWEFARYDGNNNLNYVLSDVVWQLDWLKPRIASQIITLLKKYEPKHDDTVQKAIGIVLANPGIDQTSFIALAKTKVRANTPGLRSAMWLAAWMCIESKSALKELTSILNHITNPEKATEFSMFFIVKLLGDRREHFRSEYQNYIQPDILLSLFKLMHLYIRRSEDIDRYNGGAYSPELRDDAQDARNRLFELLRNIPGKSTYLAIMDIANNTPDEQLRKWYALYARRRSEADAESGAWQPRDITLFANEAEKIPQNHRELFDLAVSRLLDLKADLENGDNSLAEILQTVKEETKHRNVIGGWLRDRSLGRYSVPQEEELADDKKPDIRIHGFGFDGPIPIELKIVDNNWTCTSLVERLNNQLCGQYLRDIRSNCGIFLLVYLGEKKYWKHPQTGEHLDFYGLCKCLQEEADKIVAKDNKIESIEIININLTKRKTQKTKKIVLEK